MWWKERKILNKKVLLGKRPGLLRGHDMRASDQLPGVWLVEQEGIPSIYSLLQPPGTECTQKPRPGEGPEGRTAHIILFFSFLLQEVKVLTSPISQLDFLFSTFIFSILYFFFFSEVYKTKPMLPLCFSVSTPLLPMVCVCVCVYVASLTSGTVCAQCRKKKKLNRCQQEKINK